MRRESRLSFFWDDEALEEVKNKGRKDKKEQVLKYLEEVLETSSVENEDKIKNVIEYVKEKTI